MKNINRLRFSVLFIILISGSCSTDQFQGNGSLEAALVGRDWVHDNVIACAASNENDDLVSVYLYPRDGATDIRYYETADQNVDKNDFKSYYPMEAPLLDVFNGYLKKFEVSATEEKWVIVS
ncbi:MAG: hypothetical protein HKN31_09455, partial [Pricia sp.]|nr:hypothetical protein [Pricia sp.]